MSEDRRFDLLVIGGGPAGYTGAIRASQLGMQVACVEREPVLGGTCLRVGCIPSKALLESSAHLVHAQKHFAQHGILAKDIQCDFSVMQKRKDQIVQGLTQGIAGLFKKNKITYIQGHAELQPKTKDVWQVQVTQKGTSQTISAKQILIATGSREAPLKGVTLDGDKIGSSTEALAYQNVPKKLVVIGAGAIGLELGSVYQRLGAEVTVLEYADRILPTMDIELSTAAQKILAKQGLVFRLNTKVQSAKWTGKKCVVEIDGDKPIECDKVLVATGRVPNTEGLNVQACGITLDARGRIPVDGRFATQASGVYAVGDVTPGAMLAHKAEEEAVACVEMLAGLHGHVNYDCIPAIVYTEPEIAAVGKTEEELKAAQVPYKRGSFPYLANARARALGATEGFVKILAHAETDRILGAHIIGAHAGDLIVELSTAMNFMASSEDIARSCHPHPTLSEIVREAALAVDKRTLNM